MKYSKILYEVKNHVAKITLNEPEKMNRLMYEMIQEIMSALEEAKGDKEVQVIVITGAGKAFCAGANIAEFRKKPAIEDYYHYEAYMKMSEVFPKVGKPTIAMVNGLALAGGCGLAIFPDITIASETAKFGLPEINVGVWSAMVSATLARVMGRKKAIELLMTGEMIDAREAERIGWVNKVVPPGELEKETMAVAEKLKEKSPVIMRLGRDSFYTMWDMNFDNAMRYLRDIIVIVLATEDSQEGVNAFLEKRKPVWKGR